MNEQFGNTDPYGSNETYRAGKKGSEKPQQIRTLDQIENSAKTDFHLDLHDTNNVLKRIGKLSMSEKLSDLEQGMKLTKLHEEFLRAQQNIPLKKAA